MFHLVGWIAFALFLVSCSAGRTQTPLSYEAKLAHAELALRGQKIFEARKWATQALEMQPGSLEAQKVMAKVLDREVMQEKALSKNRWPEELTSEERRLQAKTWLERAQSFLAVNEFDEAYLAAEKIFEFDPDNFEASHLLDQIKEKAQKQGAKESLFLRDFYQEEMNSRVERYAHEAKAWLQEGRWGMAQLAIEKILLLDPKNRQAQILLKQWESESKAKALRPDGK